MNIPISVISVVLHYEQLCRAPTSANDRVFFNTSPRLFQITSLLKCVSDFTADIFFVRKGAF